MDDSGPLTSTERVRPGAQGRLPLLVALAGSVFIAIALLKPWSLGEPAATTRPGHLGPGLETTQRPIQSPATLADSLLQATLYRRQCQSGAGWRVVTMQLNGAVPSRTLWAVEPGPMASVEQALRAESRLWAGRVNGIGFCTPGGTVAERVGRVPEVSIWTPAPGGLRPITGSSVLDAPLAAIGEVYLAPSPAFAPDGSWPAGEYLFRVSAQTDRATQAQSWFALQIVTGNP